MILSPNHQYEDRLRADCEALFIAHFQPTKQPPELTGLLVPLSRMGLTT